MKNLLSRNKKKSNFNKYNALAKQRQRSVYVNRFKALNLPLKSLRKIALLIICIVSIFGIITLISSTSFKVQDVYLIGESSDANKFAEDLNQFKGRSIFLLRKGEIRNILRNKYENIEDVYVYKVMPNIVKVEVVESSPSLVFSSFSRTLLIKRDGSVLGQVASLPELKLLDYEIKILKGEKDLNAKYIKESFLSDLSENDRKSFKWEDIQEDQKEEKYNLIKDNLFKRINDFEIQVKNQIQKTTYKELPFFFSYIDYSDSSSVMITTALKVEEGLKARALNFNDSIFTSNYTLQITIDTGKIVLFSTRREVSEQFKDLDSIIFYGRYSDSKVIDLRSEKYSIIR